MPLVCWRRRPVAILRCRPGRKYARGTAVTKYGRGFAVAGELCGASAMIVEHSPDAKRGFFASFSLQGTQVGSILATAVLLPLAASLPRPVRNLGLAHPVLF